MEDYVKEALEIVKAQAGVRTMAEEEIVSMVRKLAAGIKSMSEGVSIVSAEPEGNAKTAVKENSISCLECGKTVKVLTKKHLATHGLTPDEYRVKWNMKKGAALVCKSLQRERRKKMKSMKLWERRRNVK